jgi:hypothetical protein
MKHCVFDLSTKLGTKKSFIEIKLSGLYKNITGKIL